MGKINVIHMKGRTGRDVPNQFIIHDCSIKYKSRTGKTITSPHGNMFQSYNSNIVFRSFSGDVFLDEHYWDYSTTTGKYHNQFLGENKVETQKKIDSGEYTLCNLN